MAANDYHVIVYQILAYLYECLKEGRDVSLDALDKYKEDLMLKGKYWNYILRHLTEEGLVEGIGKVPMLNSLKPGLKFTSESAITPYGISFLLEEPIMEKAKNAIKSGAMAAATSVISTYVSSKL